MSDNPREKSIRVLKHAEHYSSVQVYNALLVLRNYMRQSDAEFLRQFLEHSNPTVVSATLFAFIHILAPVPDLFDLLLKYSRGDTRDTEATEIQCQAIQGLIKMSPSHPAALAELMRVAGLKSIPEAALADALEGLSNMYGLEWRDKYYEEMIWDPVRLEEIRTQVLEAVEANNGQ